jgi:iron complex outermembrane receptor protein
MGHRPQFKTSGGHVAIRRYRPLLWSTLSFAWVALAGAAETETSAKGVAAGAATENLEEVVITGTLIRGVAPAGTNVIGVSQAAVQESGVTTTSQLLQTIPQLGSFNNLQYPAGGFNTQTSNRPNLRNLPGFTTSGAAATLLLVDGHRVVGMGVQTTSPDADVIPPSIIERVEIVPDGGSAIYGSDAVAGVMNFITRKKFDGLELNARYGSAHSYKTFDASATVGRSWNGGSAYLAYNYSGHDQLRGRDLDYNKYYPITSPSVAGPYTTLECPQGNVTNVLTNTTYALPYTPATARPNTFNQCDLTDYATVYPQEHRNSFFGGISQDFGSRVHMDLRAFYMNRTMFQSLGIEHGSAFVGPAAFGLTPFPGQAAYFTSPASAFEIHQVAYGFGDQDATNRHMDLDTWGITPAFTFSLAGGWQLRALANYGESRTVQRTRQINPTAATLAQAAGLFNPYNPSASNPVALDALQNFETFGKSKQKQLNFRAIVDGDLFQMPGGAVKLAAGAEYLRDNYDAQTGQSVPYAEDSGYAGLSIGSSLIVPPIAAIPVFQLGRNVKSLFSEVVVPFVGASNAMSGVKELTLSVSGRHDRYSDVGSTTNPKLGLTYKPLDWLKFRAAWGKSFVAPSLADNPAADPASFNWVPGGVVAFLTPPAALVAAGKYPAIGPGQYVGVVLGTAPGITPQKAKTTSFGVDVDAPFAEGLKFDLTYWKIDYEDVIALAPFTDPITYWTYFGSTITTNPTAAQLNSILSISRQVNPSCAPQPACVYAILDVRKKNFGVFKVNGLDFATNYDHKTGWGSLDIGLNLNYELGRKQTPIPGAPEADLLANNNSRMKFRLSGGANVGDLRAQATLYHTQGYDLNPAVGLAPAQTHVGSYDVVNLFFKYDLRNGQFRDLSVTLNVDNVLDRDPPAYKGQNIVLSANGYANGATVGRLLQLGVSKKF